MSNCMQDVPQVSWFIVVYRGLSWLIVVDRRSRGLSWLIVAPVVTRGSVAVCAAGDAEVKPNLASLKSVGETVVKARFPKITCLAKSSKIYTAAG